MSYGPDLFGADPAASTSNGVGVGGGLSTSSGREPLAVRMRPTSIDEIIGQQHLLAPGAPLRRLAAGDAAMSVFLWGPPGVGKTTIASVVSRGTESTFVEISAVTAGVKEVRQVLDQARSDLARGRSTVLFVDEVHRFSKAQQDVLLPAVENRLVTLIAATTENPSFSVIAPLLSRSLLLTLKPLTDADIGGLVDRAVGDPRGLDGATTLDPEAREALVRLAGGDARRALTYLEEAAAGAAASESTTITTEILHRAVDVAAVRYDRDGDQHYDVISAFIKSLRGSDVDAALHYLARMIAAGEDPRFIARRLVILASEDIGTADNTILPLCVAAAQAVQLIGMPEARINLAHAVVACALAPKSNRSYLALGEAAADVAAGRIGTVPPHLRDAHYAGAKQHGHGVGYVYSHDVEPHGVAAQQYLPDELTDRRYFRPTERGAEVALGQRLARIDELLGRGEGPSR